MHENALLMGVVPMSFFLHGLQEQMEHLGLDPTDPLPPQESMEDRDFAIRPHPKRPWNMSHGGDVVTT